MEPNEEIVKWDEAAREASIAARQADAKGRPSSSGRRVGSQRQSTGRKRQGRSGGGGGGGGGGAGGGGAGSKPIILTPGKGGAKKVGKKSAAGKKAAKIASVRATGGKKLTTHSAGKMSPAKAAAGARAVGASHPPTPPVAPKTFGLPAVVPASLTSTKYGSPIKTSSSRLKLHNMLHKNCYLLFPGDSASESEHIEKTLEGVSPLDFVLANLDRILPVVKAVDTPMRIAVAWPENTEQLDVEDAPSDFESTFDGVILQKAVDEAKRYTFSVLYKASDAANEQYVLDAHSEYMDKDELQRTQWAYVRKGNRTIHVQHGMRPGDQFRKAGEWVDIVTWPYEVNVTTLQKAGEEPKAVTIPAGSVFMGVIWEPWAWHRVNLPDNHPDKIRGFSFGGRGQRKVESSALA